MKNRILVIDDQESIRFAIRSFLRVKGFEVCEADSCRMAREMFSEFQPDAVLMDYMMDDGTALDVLPFMKEIEPEVPIIILTAHGSIELAVRAIKEGAENLITKPIDLPSILILLERLLENRRIRHRQKIEKRRQSRNVVDPFLGSSDAIRDLENKARKVLHADSPVLIQGETGAGKGVLAKWLHDNGPRSGEAFVDLNCAGLAQEFLETELFGHQKGAFTGAVSNKVGLLETANHGTVFLDEIGDMDLQVQPKLLKALEEKQFRRMGDVQNRKVDIRLTAASNHPLEKLVEEKRFRSDLYYRINTIVLSIPPLRERKEDIPILAHHLLGIISSDMGCGEVKLLPEAVKMLQAYAWPGNIRELRNILERGLLLREGSSLSGVELNLNISSGGASHRNKDSNLNLKELERQHIMDALTESEWNIERAAQKLGIPKSSLYYKLKTHHIDQSKI